MSTQACTDDGTAVTACQCADGFQGTGALTGSGATGAGATTGTGGATGTGATTGTGGATGTGGTTSTGGTTGTGGFESVGGTVGVGGVPPAGGTVGIGGAGAVGGMVAAGGTAAAGGTVGAGGSGPPPSGGLPTNLPTATQPCPVLQTGNVNVLGSTVQMWVGNQAGGPVIFYWHATGSNSGEASSGLGQATVDQVLTNGGIIASFTTTTNTGQNTGNNVWFTGDFAIADEILACAIEQLDVDTSHIHSAGYSAGGLQTGTMAYLRSNYIASILVYSGGALITTPSPDPTNAPAIIGAHGAAGSDVLVLDFADWTTRLEDDIKARGGLAIDCNDGGGHVSGTRFGVAPNVWQFFRDHPYKVNPEPYASMPGGWPSYCAFR